MPWTTVTTRSRRSRLLLRPVMIYGWPVPVADLVERARALHRAFDGHVIEVVDRVESPGRLAIAFWHIGQWSTPVGVVEPT